MPKNANVCVPHDQVQTALGKAGAGGKPVLLVLDGAGWHMSPQVRVPKGLPPHLLPLYSPEWQPAEWLGSLTNEALSHRYFRDLDDLHAI